MWGSQYAAPDYIEGEGVREMGKQNEMVEALESFVIKKVESFDEQTSPEEIVALAELVKAINQTPRTLEVFDLEESVTVSTTSTDD